MPKRKTQSQELFPVQDAEPKGDVAQAAPAASPRARSARQDRPNRERKSPDRGHNHRLMRE